MLSIHVWTVSAFSAERVGSFTSGVKICLRNADTEVWDQLIDLNDFHAI